MQNKKNGSGAPGKAPPIQGRRRVRVTLYLDLMIGPETSTRGVGGLVPGIIEGWKLPPEAAIVVSTTWPRVLDADLTQ